MSLVIRNSRTSAYLCRWARSWGTQQEEVNAHSADGLDVGLIQPSSMGGGFAKPRPKIPGSCKDARECRPGVWLPYLTVVLTCAGLEAL